MKGLQKRWHRALAAGLTVLLVAVSVLPVATHARLFDDPYCDPHPAGEAHASPVLLAGDPLDAAGQHCEVCHWLRSMRVFDPEPALLTEPSGAALVSHFDLCSRPDAEHAISLAARAPPA